MSEELKPCPFCGGEARIDSTPYGSKVRIYWVLCEDCGAEDGSILDSQKEAKKSWNTRADTEKDRVMQQMAITLDMLRTRTTPEMELQAEKALAAHNKLMGGNYGGSK